MYCLGMPSHCSITISLAQPYLPSRCLLLPAAYDSSDILSVIYKQLEYTFMYAKMQYSEDCLVTVRLYLGK